MKKFRESVGCMIFLLGILSAFLLWQTSILGAVIIGILSLVLSLLVRPPQNCQVCDNKLKRMYYRWKIEGKNKYICPKCNNALERKRSNAAIAKL